MAESSFRLDYENGEKVEYDSFKEIENDVELKKALLNRIAEKESTSVAALSKHYKEKDYLKENPEVDGALFGVKGLSFDNIVTSEDRNLAGAEVKVKDVVDALDKLDPENYGRIVQYIAAAEKQASKERIKQNENKVIPADLAVFDIRDGKISVKNGVAREIIALDKDDIGNSSRGGTDELFAKIKESGYPVANDSYNPGNRRYNVLSGYIRERLASWGFSDKETDDFIRIGSKFGMDVSSREGFDAERFAEAFKTVSETKKEETFQKSTAIMERTVTGKEKTGERSTGMREEPLERIGSGEKAEEKSAPKEMIGSGKAAEEDGSEPPKVTGHDVPSLTRDKDFWLSGIRTAYEEISFEDYDRICENDKAKGDKKLTKELALVAFIGYRRNEILENPDEFKKDVILNDLARYELNDEDIKRELDEAYRKLGVLSGVASITDEDYEGLSKKRKELGGKSILDDDEVLSFLAVTNKKYREEILKDPVAAKKSYIDSGEYDETQRLLNDYPDDLKKLSGDIKDGLASGEKGAAIAKNLRLKLSAPLGMGSGIALVTDNYISSGKIVEPGRKNDIEVDIPGAEKEEEIDEYAPKDKKPFKDEVPYQVQGGENAGEVFINNAMGLLEYMNMAIFRATERERRKLYNYGEQAQEYLLGNAQLGTPGALKEIEDAANKGDWDFVIRKMNASRKAFTTLDQVTSKKYAKATADDANALIQQALVIKKYEEMIRLENPGTPEDQLKKLCADIPGRDEFFATMKEMRGLTSGSVDPKRHAGEESYTETWRSRAADRFLTTQEEKDLWADEVHGVDENRDNSLRLTAFLEAKQLKDFTDIVNSKNVKPTLKKLAADSIKEYEEKYGVSTTDNLATNMRKIMDGNRGFAAGLRNGREVEA